MSDSAKDSKPTAGKGHATPSRKEREAARKRPLVGNRGKEARAASRADLAQKRAQARAGMLAGEERYLGPRDKGPQKRFARDWVDSRFSGGELLLPVAFGSVILSTINNEAVQVASMFALWGLMAFIVANSWFISNRLATAAKERWGEDKLERGLKMYAVMRSLQMRPMRLPKPQVKRGEKIG
ncbi:MAG: DUF3043 domain-containing protein [Microbacteriaceae bacterium]|nr:DUF3043 domain-containing protein [Microbacteriaceae bacterium]